MSARQCNQCWKWKPWPEAFVSPFTGRQNQKNCTACCANRRAPVEPRRGLDPEAPLAVRVVLNSGNRKHRGIPSTISSPSTCPPSCSFYGRGCFAEYHLMRNHWAATPEVGLDWFEFCEWVRKLPKGQLWRHNDAGDLPGKVESLDRVKLGILLLSNWSAGARGFTFCHKQLPTRQDRELVLRANRAGFTINLSADSLEHADARAELGIGPVAVVLPTDARGPIRTPAGRPVAICPAQTRDIGCKECQLCARPNRTGIVGFLAHGQNKALVSQIVQLKTKEAACG